MELPPIDAMVIEYRFHQLGCDTCCHLSRADFPSGVPIGLWRAIEGNRGAVERFGIVRTIVRCVG